MSNTVDRIVIVGASLAGGTAAVTLRQQGYTGRLVLIGTERQPPYERPPLSKALMLGDTDEPDWVQPAASYDEQNITWLAGHHGHRDPTGRPPGVAGRHASTATTSWCWRPGPARGGCEIPGADLDGVLTLRTLDDALALRSRLTDGARRRHRRRRLDRLRGGRRRPPPRVLGDHDRSG